jgi:hypothetical protein
MLASFCLSIYLVFKLCLKLINLLFNLFIFLLFVGEILLKLIIT